MNRRPILPCLMLCACAGGSLAKDLPPEPTVERPLWEAGIGVGALRLPHYRGSDQSHGWLLPVPYLVYRGDIFKADREGTRAVLFESDRVDFDLSLAASAPTRSRDSQARQGMPDLAPTIEIGPNLNWTLGRGRLGHPRGTDWELTLRAPLRAVVTMEGHPRHIGWNSPPHINLDLHDASGWNWGLQAGPVFANRRLNSYFYDVSPAQAMAGRPAYQAAGGFSGWQFTGALSRRFDKQWVGMFVKFDSLQGAHFGDSPLVRQRQQVSLGIAASWILASSERRVQAPE